MNKFKGHVTSLRISNSVVYGLLLLLCLVDNFNAVLQKSLGLSGTPAQMYKILLLGLCILGANAVSRRIVIVLVLYSVAMPIIHGFISPMADMAWLVNDFGFTLKCVYAYVVAFFVSDSGQGYYKEISRVMFVSFCVLAANLILSLWGFGYSQYVGGVGALGYFIAGNEMSGMQLILTSFVVSFAYRHRLSMYLVVSAFCIVLGIIKGTKTGAIGVVLIVLATPIMMGGVFECKIHIKRILILLLLFLSALPLLAAVVIRLIAKVGILDRFIWFLNHKGILGAVFSDRELRVIPFLNEYSEQWTVTQKLFGLGFPDGGLYGFKELDALDLLFSQGLVGLTLIYIAWIGAFVYAFKCAINGNRFAAQGLFLIVLLMVLSNLSGHIVYSGLAMPFFGLYLGSLKIVDHGWRNEST